MKNSAFSFCVNSFYVTYLHLASTFPTNSFNLHHASGTLNHKSDVLLLNFCKEYKKLFQAICV